MGTGLYHKWLGDTAGGESRQVITGCSTAIVSKQRHKCPETRNFVDGLSIDDGFKLRWFEPKLNFLWLIVWIYNRIAMSSLCLIRLIFMD